MDLRFDRFVTLYIVSPMRRLAPEKLRSIPILMYHSIADEDESERHPYYRTSTSATSFAAQTEWLSKNGYKTCNPAEAVGFLKSGTESASKRVVITFDDGYRNFYQKAFPILDRLGFSAVVYLPTAYIGEQTLKFNGQDCLTWGEVRELQKYGISFGSHTVTHPQLSGLADRDIRMEIVNSKNAIEEKTGSVVDSFAYPYAFPQTKSEFRKVLRNSLLSAGYKNGVCTMVGRAGPDSDPFFLERLPMNSSDDSPLFKAKLAGAYDWISRSQFVVRAVKDRTAKTPG